MVENHGGRTMASADDNALHARSARAGQTLLTARAGLLRWLVFCAMAAAGAW
jgi:hypothetical protein